MIGTEKTSSEQFIQLLTVHQPHLQGYILASLGNRTDCDDVLQKTNLVLWKKSAEFRSGAQFLPWALAIARFEVLAFCRDRQRDRLVFHDDVAELMSEEALPEMNEVSERQKALQACIERLSEVQKEVLRLRYVGNKRIHEISELMHRTASSIKVMLFRTRRALKKCIEFRLMTNVESTKGVHS